MSHKPWDVTVLNAAQALAADDDSGQGRIQLDGTNGILKGSGIPVYDITGWKNEAYTAGAAHVIDGDYTGTTLAANHEYTVTIKFLNDVLTSYTFSTIFKTAPANAAAIVNALVAEINESSIPVTASLVNTDDLRITVDSVEEGEIVVTDSEGNTWTDSTAYVAPIGTVAEVEDQAGTGKSVAGGQYIRIAVYWDRKTRHNGVSGAVVGVPTKSVIYIDGQGAKAANAAALAAAIEDHLDGTTAATWAGVPSL